MRTRSTALLVLSLALASPSSSPADEPEAPIYLTPRDAVAMALTNSPNLEADAYLALSGAQDVRAAQGLRDLLFYLNTLYTDSERPSTSSLTGNQQKIWTLSAGLRQVLVTGTSYEVEWNSARQETDFPFSVLDPNYRVDATLSVTQPLLRGFGLEVNRAREEIAGHIAEGFAAQVQGRAASTVESTLSAFWDLVLARSIHDVKQGSVRRAERLLETVRAQIQRGLLAEVEALKADVAAATRRDELVLARKAVRDAEDLLRDLVAPDHDPALWSRELVPVQDPEDGFAGHDLELEQRLERALAERTEIIQAQQEVEAKKKALRLARNDLLPRLNLLGSVRVEGLAGTDRTQALDEVSPEFADFLDRLGVSAPGLASAIGDFVALFTNSRPVDKQLTGGYLDAVENLDFFTWSVGVNIEIPLFNDTAEARYLKSVYEERRSHALSRTVERKIRLEVREAARRVESGRERLGTTALARRLAEQNLEAEEKKLSRGYATSQDVLDAQVTLDESRAQELRAQADLEKSWIRYARSTGSLLADVGHPTYELPDDPIDVPFGGF